MRRFDWIGNKLKLAINHSPVLEGDGLEEKKHHFHRRVGFVRVVSPQPMSASCDAKSTR
jgi:hypothetical protein